MGIGRFLRGGTLPIAEFGVNSVEIPGSRRGLRLALLLGVDGGDVGGGLGVRRDQAGLFAMTYEVLEALDGTHRGRWFFLSKFNPESAGWKLLCV